mmetsp:Transcript_40935/g.87186  ORF Transcript_40935/g.87186 Transcript_40935/m.87186 type:complete len:123 (-) Transcript_40935:13-381(-)
MAEEEAFEQCWGNAADTKGLADTVRALLEAAAGACGALAVGAEDAIEGASWPPEAEAGCRRVRGLLRLRLVARVVREFTGGLLYLVLTSDTREEDARTWATRPRLVQFLHALCGSGDKDLCD